MAEETNLAEWGAGQIAGGAFGALGSGLFGMALSGLGVGFPDATADAISALRSQLQMIETQIVGLKNEVADVMNRVGIAEADDRRQDLGRRCGRPGERPDDLLWRLSLCGPRLGAGCYIKDE